MHKKFDGWYYAGTKCDVRVFSGGNKYYAAKDAWNYQQRKIDKLNSLLLDSVELIRNRSFDYTKLWQDSAAKLTVACDLAGLIDVTASMREKLEWQS